MLTANTCSRRNILVHSLKLDNVQQHRRDAQTMSRARFQNINGVIKLDIDVEIALYCEISGRKVNQVYLNSNEQSLYWSVKNTYEITLWGRSQCYGR